jgi:hypothetical protein
MWAGMMGAATGGGGGGMSGGDESRSTSFGDTGALTNMGISMGTRATGQQEMLRGIAPWLVVGVVVLLLMKGRK